MLIKQYNLYFHVIYMCKKVLIYKLLLFTNKGSSDAVTILTYITIQIYIINV